MKIERATAKRDRRWVIFVYQDDFVNIVEDFKTPLYELEKLDAVWSVEKSLEAAQKKVKTIFKDRMDKMNRNLDCLKREWGQF